MSGEFVGKTPDKPGTLNEGSDSSGQPIWQQVLETPGFMESWERARQQARAGEVVPLNTILELLDSENPPQITD